MEDKGNKTQRHTNPDTQRGTEDKDSGEPNNQGAKQDNLGNKE